MIKNFVKRTLVIILLFIMAIQAIPFSMYGMESFAAETTINGLGPLCFTAEEAGAKVKLYKEYYATAPPISLEYKTEGTTSQDWQSYTLDTTITLTNIGDKVYFRNPSESDQGFNVSASKYVKFSISEAKAAASGDITSLINKNGTTTLSANCFYSLFYGCDKLTEAPALPATNLANDCCYWMFSDCSELRKAPALPATNLADNCYYGMFRRCNKITEAPALPATTLAGNCYDDMFSGCQNLVEAPILPATTMVGGCYAGMFWDCSKLKEAPALPATTLAVGCYQGMFQGCSSLEEAPALPATVMATRCYNNMFGKCRKLKKAPALPATALEEDCCNSMFSNCYKLETVKVNFTDWGAPSIKTNYWLDNVSSNGTFTCPNSLPETTGSGYIPSGWTISKFTSLVPVEKIVTSSDAVLAVGDTEKLTVNVTNNSDQEATFADCIICSADDTSIVSVKSVSSGKIKIKGLKTGTTTLTIWNSTAPSITKTCTVTVDGTKPTVALSSSNNLADKQTITLTGTDNKGIEKYYFGPDASGEPDKTEGISGGALNTSVEVSASGTYYLSAKDAAGNKSETASITFHKTTFSVSNGSTSVEAVLTASGESFALPGISANACYTAPATWSNGMTPGTNYEATGNAALTAECTENVPTISAEPTINTSLVYNGTSQGLITAATVIHGTAYYALGIDGTTTPSAEAWSTTVPASTNAGTYYVWWKVSGDANYKDVDSAYLGQVAIAKATQTISAESTLTFDIASSNARIVATAESALHYSIVTGDSVISVSDDGSLTIKSAGEAIVKIVAEETENYNGATLEVNVKITQQPTPESTQTGIQGSTRFYIGKTAVHANMIIENGIVNIEDISKDEFEKVVKENGGKILVDSIYVSFSTISEHIEGVRFTTSTWNNISEMMNSSKNKLDRFEIIMSDANIDIDTKAVKSIKNQANGKHITFIAKENPNGKSEDRIFSVCVESDGTAISDLKGGKAIVKVAFSPATGKKSKNYKFYHIGKDEKMQRMATKYSKGIIKFATTHFSDFALVYKTKQETLPLKAKASGSNKIKLSWNGVDAAKKYVLYGAKKNKSFKKLKTIIGKKSYTLKKVSGEKIKANNSYKFYVVEYDCFGNKTKSKKISYTVAKKK